MPQEAKWNMHYEELVEFHTANGHCNVPRDFSCLGKWVNNQRQSNKNCKLSSNRIQLLDALGFAWSFGDSADDGIVVINDGHGRWPRLDGEASAYVLHGDLCSEEENWLCCC
jgi:hypothetical protein